MMEGISLIEKPQPSDYSRNPGAVNAPRHLDIIREEGQEGLEDHHGNFLDPFDEPS